MIYAIIAVYLGISSCRFLAKRHVVYEVDKEFVDVESGIFHFFVGPSAGSEEVVFRNRDTEIRLQFRYHQLTVPGRVVLGVIWPWFVVTRIWDFVTVDEGEPRDVEEERK